MGFLTPAAVDPITLDIQPSPSVGGVNVITGPYTYGGNLFTVLCSYAATPVIDVFKSSDLGVTWVPLNHVAAPAALEFKSAFDGIQTLNVLLDDLAGSMRIISFDLLTETWGVPSASTPSGVGSFAVFSRPDGSSLAIIVSTATPAHWQAVMFSGGAWGVPFNFDTNAFLVMTAPVGASTLFGCTDSTGRLHLFFVYVDNPGTPTTHLFYQAVETTNALGSFFEFPGVGTVITEVNGLRGSPGITAAAIVLPAITIAGADNELSVYVGTPIAAPSWTLFSTIDPGHTTPGGVGYDQPTAHLVGGLLRIVYTPDFATIRVCETADFTTWVFTSSTVFDVATSPVPPGFAFPGQFVFDELSTSPGIEFTALAPDQSTLQRFFLPFTSGAPLAFVGTPGTGQVGTPYTFAPVASGGTPPYVFTSPGPLPPGMTLDPVTGIISGTGTAMGTFCFSITVTDSLGAFVTLAVCIAVYGAVVITMLGWKLYPNVVCEDAVEGLELPSVKRAM